MKRCCLFFLAFVTAVFLAVFTGSFDNQQGSNRQLANASESSIASKDKLDLSGQELTKNPGAGFSKITKP